MTKKFYIPYSTFSHFEKKGDTFVSKKSHPILKHTLGTRGYAIEPIEFENSRYGTIQTKAFKVIYEYNFLDVKYVSENTIPCPEYVYTVAYDDKKYDVIDVLLNKYPEIHTLDSLHKACYRGYLPAVKFLIERGVEANIHDLIKRSAPYYDVVEYLFTLTDEPTIHHLNILRMCEKDSIGMFNLFSKHVKDFLSDINLRKIISSALFHNAIDISKKIVSEYGADVLKQHPEFAEILADPLTPSQFKGATYMKNTPGGAKDLKYHRYYNYLISL